MSPHLLLVVTTLAAMLIVGAGWTEGAGLPGFHRDPVPIADEVVSRLVPESLRRRPPSTHEQLERYLEDATSLIERLEAEDGQGAADVESDKARTTRLALAAKTEEIRAARRTIADEAAEIRARFIASGLGAQVGAWDELTIRVDAAVQHVLRDLDRVHAATRPAERTAAMRTTRDQLQALRTRVTDRETPAGGPLNPNTTVPPERHGIPDPTPAPLPAYARSQPQSPVRYADATGPGTAFDVATAPLTPVEASACSYTSADLGESAEIQLTAEIRELAAELGYSPIRIFQHVHRTIAFEPYWGSVKGALGTLWSGEGNATDQASLLIALLRAANVPARYVKGRIQFANDDRVLRWVGAKGYRAAGRIFSYGWVPASWGTDPPFVEMTHVWVEACVPYTNYRGTGLDQTGHRWIPLDPSFKPKDYQAGIPIDVAFDYAGYMARRTSVLPTEKYAEQVESAVRSLGSNNTLQDVPYRGTVSPLELDILPASLPYRVLSFTAWAGIGSAETAEVPDSHRWKLEVIPQKGTDAEPSVNDLVAYWPAVVLSMPDIALKRVTFSYKGATAPDVASLAAWKNSADPNVIAPCSPGINVVPVVKVDGVEQPYTTPLDPARTNGPVPFCASTSQRLALRVTIAEYAWTFTAGRPIQEYTRITFPAIKATDYHALFSYVFQASDRVLAARADRLLESVRSLTNPHTDQDETEGEYLHLVGLKYMRYANDARNYLTGLDGGLNSRAVVNIGLSSAAAAVAYVLDQPFAVYRRGFLVDMPAMFFSSFDSTTGDMVWKTFQLFGYAASMYESYVWQENARLDAISAVRGLQYAREIGMPIITLNSANWATESAQLAYPSGWVTSIKAWVDAGYTVETPNALFWYENWRGAVWIALRQSAETGWSGGYIISGSYAGGYSVSTPVPQTLIFKVANPDGTTGEAVVIVADGNVSLGSAPGNVTAGDPVNMVTGNMYHAERDVSIKGRGGLPIVFERHYNSLQPQDGPLGFGWTHTFNQYLLFKDDNADHIANGPDTDGVTSSVVWTDGTGAQKIIRVAGEGPTCGPGPGAVFQRPRGFFFDVTRNADLTYTVREKNGLTYTFEPVEGIVGARAKLIAIADRNGNRLSLTYTAGRLTAVTDDLGRSLTFIYDGNGRITQVADFTDRLHQYTYDTAGHLIAYRNPLAVSGVQNPVTYSYYAGSGLDHAMQAYTLPRGNGMTFEYYADGRVFRHYNTLGETTTFTYNGFRRESASVNERGFTRRYFFDEFGNATKIVEEAGGEWRYTYDANPATPHHRVSQQTPLGYETRYCYDANGNVTREITPWSVTAGESCATATPGPGTVSYEYFNGFGQPQKIKDARGNYTIVKYDARSNVTERIGLRTDVGAAITDPAGYLPAAADVVAWSIHTYDAVGNLLTTKTVRDPATLAGPTMTYAYDAQSLSPISVARSGDKDGDGVVGGGEVDVATLTHDALGRVTAGISTDWHATAFTYDAVDRVVTFRDGLGKMRAWRYDDNGNKIAEDLPGVDQWTAGYDLSDRKVMSANAAGVATTRQYDPAGNVVAVTNPDGFTLRFEYDAGNRVVRARDEEGLSVSRTLAVDGKPRTVTDPNGLTTSFAYWGPERHGRLKSKTAPPAAPGQAGLETQYDYDAGGNVIRATVVAADGSGTQETLTSYDERNRPTRIVGPLYTNVATGQAERLLTCLTYNLLGFRTEVRAGGTADATGTTPACGTLPLQTQSVYDDFGRKLRETDALGRAWVTSYDVHGNPLATTDPKGQTTSFTWGQGRQLLTRTAGGQTTRWTRNDLGQVTQVFLPEPTALYSYTYDAAHRLASVTDHRGPKTLTYNWSPGGLLNFFEDSDGQRTDYSYDPHGRLTQIWAPNGDVVDFLYDAGGRLTEKWFPNGVQAQYAWNGDGTLASLTNRHGPTTITSHVYGYDGFRNRRTHTETIGGTTTPYRYGYDNVNRLIEVQHDQTSALLESYAYDALGNRTRKTDAAGNITAYVHDAANQLLEARQGSATGALLMAFVYDANGNLTKKCEGGGVTASPTTCSGTTVMDLTYDTLNRLAQVAKTGLSTQTYAYDDSGRRIQKTTGPTVTNYLYNGEDVHATFGATWANTATYTHGPNTDDPIIQTAASAARYFHADGVGSLVAVTTTAGVIYSAMRYDAWGNVIASTGAAPIYGYTSREPDETGLIYYRARYYDPTIGRFGRRDPLGLIGGLNPYVYAAANPVNLVDPYGLTPQPPNNQDETYVSPKGPDGGPGRQVVQRPALIDPQNDPRSILQETTGGPPSLRDIEEAFAPSSPNDASSTEVAKDIRGGIPKSPWDILEGGIGGMGGGSPGRGRRPSPAQRDQVLERSRDTEGVPRCELCGGEITTQPGRPNSFEVDHRIPWSRGGKTVDENLGPDCRRCNRSKGANTVEEFLQQRRQ